MWFGKRLLFVVHFILSDILFVDYLFIKQPMTDWRTWMLCLFCGCRTTPDGISDWIRGFQTVVPVA